MQYKCIKQFELPLIDCNGFPKDEVAVIDSGTIWFEDDECNIIGGDVHLENKNMEWIEITNEDLNEYFEELR